MINDSDEAAKPQRAQRIQIPPVGTEPDNASLFLCAVMRSSAGTMSRLAKHVHPDDLLEPGATVYRAALDLAGRNHSPSPALVRGELKRHGLNRSTELWVLNAITTGAEPMAIRLYAANVVSDRLRALYGSLGHALSTGADTETEASLLLVAEQAAKQLRAVADRLDGLRGE